MEAMKVTMNDIQQLNLDQFFMLLNTAKAVVEKNNNEAKQPSKRK